MCDEFPDVELTGGSTSKTNTVTRSHTDATQDVRAEISIDGVSNALAAADADVLDGVVFRDRNGKLLTLVRIEHPVPRVHQQSRITKTRSESFTLYSPSHTQVTITGGDLSIIDFSELDVTYSPDSLLGQGACGEVHRGTWLFADVAVKRLKKHDQRQLEDYARETTILSSLRHYNIVTLMGVCIDDPHFCIVTELMTGGDLHNVLHVPPLSAWEWLSKIHCIVDVAMGMAYLHHHGIAHRDLKPRNILTDAGHTVFKIMDFGISSSKWHARADGDVVPGTPRYMAPEIFLKSSSPASNKGFEQDVFSFGCVGFEVVTRTRAFGTSGRSQNWALPPGDLPDKCPPALTTLLRSCYHVTPRERPTFSSILRDLKKIKTITHGSSDDFLKAIKQSDVEKVGRLLEMAAISPNTLDKEGRPALCLAAAHSDACVVSMLLEAGATVSAIDSNKAYASHYAARAGRLDSMSLLVDAGVELNRYDSAKHTPFEYARQRGDVAMIKFLVKSGANVSNLKKVGGEGPVPSSRPRRVDSANLNMDEESYLALIDQVTNVVPSDMDRFQKPAGFWM